jgi:hypothetical protein
MRHANHLVFDDFMPQGTTHTAPYYTGTQHNAQLGRHSMIAIQAVADTVGGTPLGTLRVALEHSADGRNWIQRKGSTGGDFDLETATLQATTTATAVWCDDFRGNTTPTGPILGFVRFRIYFSNGTTQAHVKLYVTQRDR